MILYFDTCCYGRHRDDQKDAKIAAETMAIMTVIEAARIAGHPITGSMAIMSELGDMREGERKQGILGFYASVVDDTARLTEKDFIRAQSFIAHGLKQKDSLQLAAAEAAGAGFLLTVDVDFAKIATKKNLSAVKVINPLNFLAEGMK